MTRLKRGAGVCRPTGWNGDAMHDARAAIEMPMADLHFDLQAELKIDGLALSTLYAYEAGKSTPPMRVVRALAKILRVPVKALVKA